MATYLLSRYEVRFLAVILGFSAALGWGTRVSAAEPLSKTPRASLVTQGGQNDFNDVGAAVVIRTTLLEVDGKTLSQAKVNWNPAGRGPTELPLDVRSAVVAQSNGKRLVERLKSAGAKVVAEPTVVTLDGREADFRSGGEVASGEATKENPAARPLVFFGTRFKATPTLLSEGGRLLELEFEHSVRFSEEGHPARIRARSFSTATVIPDGDTLLLCVDEPFDKHKPAHRRASLLAWIEIEAADATLPEPRSSIDENPWKFRLSATLLTIEEAQLRKAGIAWGRSVSDGDRGLQKGRTAIVEAAEIASTLDRLKMLGAQVLSRPEMMTIDGQEASVQTGREFLRCTAEVDGVSFASRQTLLVSLVSKPTRLASDRVRLELAAEHGLCAKDQPSVDGKVMPILSTGNFSANVVLEPRQAMLLSIPYLSEPTEKGNSPTSLVACVVVDSMKRLIENDKDELAELRDEIKDLRAQIARLSAAAPLRATASTSPPRRISVDRASATEPLETVEAAKESFITKIYAVADLVVPVAEILAVRGGGNESRRLRASQLFEEPTLEPSKADKADFEPLVDFIKQATEPDSWKGRGCAIVPLEVNLSLVVSQTPAVHKQIAVLLEDLRARQDQMVQFSIEVVSATLDEAERVGLDLVERRLTLTPKQLDAARELFRDGSESKVVAAPKILLANERMCEFQTLLSQDRPLHVMLFANIENDDVPSVRFNLAVNAKDAADVVRSGVFAKTEPGQTFVLDVTDRVNAGQPERGVPVLQKIPYTSRLFKNTGRGESQRTLLFITPTVRNTAADGE